MKLVVSLRGVQSNYSFFFQTFGDFANAITRNLTFSHNPWQNSQLKSIPFVYVYDLIVLTEILNLHLWVHI